jgi:dihydropteroate synthase
MRLALRQHTLELSAGEPIVMGILNIGVDSVADSSVFQSVEEQVQRGLALAAAGARIIDVGVLSGRTDTGAHLINDTSGLIDPAVADMAAETGAGLVVMHTRAAPKQEHFPGYEDPVADVLALLHERVALALGRGVEAEQLVIDPGLDYAKAPQESIDVLRRLGELAVFQRPILLAVSRKYFIGMLTDTLPQERLAGTIAALEFGVSLGAQIVRVHDVAQVSQYLRLRAALHGSGPVAMLGGPQDERLKWIAPKR